MTDPTPAELIMSDNLVNWAEIYIQRAVTVAAEFGMEVTLGQVLAAFLLAGNSMSEIPLTYEQYLYVWKKYQDLVAQAANAQFGSGPEVTAEAPDAETATRMAEHWAEKVNDVALGGAGVSKDDWTRWEAQFDA